MKIIKTLKEAGYKAYWAGGVVRDYLLEIPNHDIDIATDATPNEVKELFPDAIMTDDRMGVVLVKDGNEYVEVVTFRGERNYADHRHPSEVEFVKTVEEDVKRRDFTINGMLMDPETKEILDYVGGEKDLEDSIIRAIGDPDERFKEDPVRMIRAIRFAAKLEFHIDIKTWESIKRNVELIRLLSGERIYMEINKIFQSRNTTRAFELLYVSGILEIILPEVAALKYLDDAKEFHPEKDVWEHTMLMVEDSTNTLMSWCCLLHDTGKPVARTKTDRVRFNGHDVAGAWIAKDVLERLHVCSKDADKIVYVVRHHMKVREFTKMRKATLKKYLADENFQILMELSYLDATSSQKMYPYFPLNLDAFNFIDQYRCTLTEEQIKPKPLINGDDLISLGIRPGPIFKVILSDVSDKQLNEEIETKEDAIEFVKTYYKGV